MKEEGAGTAAGGTPALPAEEPSRACACAREGEAAADVTAEDVVSGYVDAVNGTLHIIRFGCMMVVLDRNLTRATTVNDKGQLTGREPGVNAWLAANVPAGQTIAVIDAGAARYFARGPVIDLLGLNHHRLLHRVPGALDIERIAVVSTFPGSLPLLRELSSWRPVHRVAAGRLTICDCPRQSELVAYQRVRGGMSAPEGSWAALGARM